MVRIHPFRALRPQRGRASEVSCPPYDTLDRARAIELAKGRPDSFLHVVRSDIDLPAEADPHGDEAYSLARGCLDRVLGSGVLVREEAERCYAYRMVRGGRRQCGLVCCVDVDDYRANRIRKHELTRPDKETDRTRHILALEAHAEPVLLASTEPGLAELLRGATNQRPLYHFDDGEGTTHSLWLIEDSAPYVEHFAAVERLWVADGHHRCAAASKAAAAMLAEGAACGDAPCGRFPALIVPAAEMVIAPYHRLLLGALGMDAEAILAAIATRARVEPTALTAPHEPGTCLLRTPGRWHLIRLGSIGAGRDLSDGLDASLLQERVLAPALGIEDPRCDDRLGFIGGVGPDCLAAMVDDGRALAAFAMRPVCIEEVLAVSDSGGIMPPKSTWFEPKPRSGLFVHDFAQARR